MLGVPQPAGIRALEDTLLFVIPKHNFETFIKDKPDLANRLAEELAKRQEIVANCQIKLKELGLIEESDPDQNPVVWIRKRIQKLFNLRP
jgi:CRP-like cAMP-binding protein